MNSSSKPPHFFQIDLLKGLAIIGVLILHIASPALFAATPSHYLAWEEAAPSVATRTLILLFVGQALPIFLVVMGVTSGLSFIKRGYVSFMDCYSRDYFSRRFWRFYIPYLVFLIPAIFVGLYDQAWAHNKLSVIPLALSGVVTTGAGGSYFIFVIFQFVLIFPLLFYIYKKSPSLLLVACFATTFVFWLLYSYSHTIDQRLYEWCVVRFLPEIGLGLCIAGDFELLSSATRFSELGKKAYLYVSCALIGFILIFLGNLREFTLISGPWTQALVLLDPFWLLYSTGLVILGIHYLPKSARGRFSLSLALVGAASYHIFLAQIIYFRLFSETQVYRFLLWSPHSTATLSWVLVLASISACIILGILFMYGTNKLERTLRHRS